MARASADRKPTDLEKAIFKDGFVSGYSSALAAMGAPTEVAVQLSYETMRQTEEDPAGVEAITKQVANRINNRPVELIEVDVE